MNFNVGICLLMLTNFGIDAQRQRCRKEVYTVDWWEYPPYITQNGSKIAGVFPTIIRRMVNACCNSPVNVTFLPVLRNRNEAVERIGNGTADFVLPMIVKTGKSKLLSFPFVPVVDSPGIAFYTSPPRSAGESLLYIIAASFPVLILTIILALIAGTMFWILENNGSPFGISVLSRAQDGIWWAFISMTTVGYGDIYPKTRQGQVLAVIWIFVGIVGVSIFVANVSSFLTASCISQEADLSGVRVAVMTGSQEHSLAVRSSATPMGCNSVTEMAQILRGGDCSGALLESYVAGYHQELFQEFRLNDFREDLFSYGVVLRPSVAYHEQCYKNFILSRQDYIFGIVSQNILPLKKTKDTSAAEEMSTTFLHFNSFAIYVPISILLGIICVLFATCYLRDLYSQDKRYGGRKKRDRKKPSKEVDSLRELEQDHLREITRCLEQLHSDASFLQETCNGLRSRTENEGLALFSKAWIERETTV